MTAEGGDLLETGSFTFKRTWTHDLVTVLYTDRTHLISLTHKVNACPLKMAAIVDGNTSNELTVVTYRNPAQLPPSVTNQTAVSNVGNGSNPQMLTFLKIQPKALGTVQIMNGVVTFLIGFGSGIYFFYITSVISVFAFCTPLVYVITGSCTVRAENKLLPHVIKCALAMNVVSAVVAGIAVIVLSINALGSHIIYFGFSGVLVSLSLLQFIVSICISAFGCKATCCTQPVVQLVAVTSSAPPYPQELSEYNRTTMNPPPPYSPTKPSADY